MPRRSGSSSRWRQRQERDIYVEQAGRDGWRSRAVFKLEQINAKERLLRPGAVVVDLGSSPGSWSQLAAKLVAPGGRVIAVDLLPMDALPGVEFVLGDFTTARDASGAASQARRRQGRSCNVGHGAQHHRHPRHGPAPQPRSNGRSAAVRRGGSKARRYAAHESVPRRGNRRLRAVRSRLVSGL